MERNPRPGPGLDYRLSAVWRFACATALTLFVGTAFAASKTASFTILHTNDLHGHVTSWQGWQDDLAGKNVGGMDRIAAEVSRIRSQAGADKVLLLDAGDTLGDTLAAAKTEGRVLIEAMNSIGYDAMVVGNHEVDFTAETLRRRVAEAKFPVLAANMLDQFSAELFTKPYIIKNVNGIKVGILGLAYPNTRYTTAKKNLKGVRFVDAQQAAARYVPLMRRDGAELVIALTHLGLSSDKQLAEQVEGIDVIVGGHSHNRMREAMIVGPTIIVQAGAHGSDLGRLDLNVESDGRRAKIVRHQRQLIALTGEGDARAKAQIESQLKTFQAEADERVGRAQSPIVRAQTLAGDKPRSRDEESPADDLFADAIRESTNSEIAFLPGVGYGVAIPAGEITAAALKNLVPHDSEVVTMTLSGRQIKSILEQSIENFSAEDPREKVGGMIQVSGLTFAYDPRKRKGARVESINVAGAPLDAAKRYRVATNSLLAEGGHKYDEFKRGRDEQKHGKQFEMISGWLKKQNAVSTPPTNRIRKLAEQPGGS